MALIGFVVVFVGCGPDRTEAVADIEAMFPTLARYRVTNLFRTEDCEYISYARGTFVTDPASFDCEIDVEGPFPRKAFDHQAWADLDAICAESERFGPRLQHAFPEYGTGDSIIGGSFGFDWDRTYVYEPAWTDLPPDGSEKYTAVDDDWYEVSSAVSIGLFD